MCVHKMHVKFMCPKKKKKKKQKHYYIHTHVCINIHRSFISCKHFARLLK